MSLRRWLRARAGRFASRMHVGLEQLSLNIPGGRPKYVQTAGMLLFLVQTGFELLLVVVYLDKSAAS